MDIKFILAKGEAMLNKDWGVGLRKAHLEVVNSMDARRRPLRFPSDIKLDGDHECVHMKLLDRAPASNMQTNAAAFEAWALALHVWCGAKRVVLDWESIDDKDGTLGYRHYQRFLYRVEKFRSWFPSWFGVANADALRDAEAIAKSGLVLNVSNSDRKAEAVSPEAKLERQLKSSKRFRKHFSLVKVGTQFPVGLFRGEVATKNQVFPGGSAAIDLIAQDEQDCLCLFELKAGMNIPAGIISELLFCTWVMQDAMTGHFQFGAEPSAEKGEIKPVDIRACKTIKARFIGNKFHPLLDGGDILAELNKAGVGTSPAVRFGLTEVVGEGEPFHFKDSP